MMCDPVNDFLESQFFRYVSLGMKEDVARALVELFEKGCKKYKRGISPTDYRHECVSEKVNV
jgi:hypothetical protein